MNHACQQNSFNRSPLPEAESYKSEGNRKIASGNLYRQIYRPVFCFALFLVRIKKAEVATISTICGI